MTIISRGKDDESENVIRPHTATHTRRRSSNLRAHWKRLPASSTEEDQHHWNHDETQV